MSRLDQSRPAKRVKHAHSATSGRELSNGVASLLDTSSGIDNGRKLKAKLSSNKVNGSRTAQLDESRAVVQANGDIEMQDETAGVIEISSDAHGSSADNSDEDKEEDDEVEANDDGQENDYGIKRPRKRRNEINTYQNGALNQLQSTKSLQRNKRAREDIIANGKFDDGEARANSQSALQDKNDTDKSNMTEEPSFGELLQAHAPTEPIDVTSALAMGESNDSLETGKDHTAAITTPARNTNNGPITANSLGTVLTQALRTNDNDLLESCLGLTDYAGVRATIERLPSHLTTILLLRLAERLHRRPGRAGNLMIWVQWSLVAHGGYLASQPEAVAKLSILRRVVRERADGLQPLLRLKGKLDMLAAQSELRKKMKQRRPQRGAEADDEDDEDEDDEGVIYVEGAEKDENDDDNDDDGDGGKGSGDDLVMADDEEEVPKPSKRKIKKKKTSLKSTTEPNESSSEIDAMPTTSASLANDMQDGSLIDHDDDEEDEKDEEEEDNSDENLIDDEAEETDRDTGDDDDDLSDGSDLDGFIDDGEDLEEEEEEDAEDD